MRPSVRDVRVLTAPDHEQFAVDVVGAGEGVVVHAFAEAAFVDVGGVEAGGGRTSGFIAARKARWPPMQMPMRAEFAGAVGAGGEMVERRRVASAS